MTKERCFTSPPEIFMTVIVADDRRNSLIDSHYDHDHEGFNGIDDGEDRNQTIAAVLTEG